MLSISNTVLSFALLMGALLSTSARAEEDLLPAEQAFPLSVERDRNGDLLLAFEALPGYAIYANRISISAADGAGRIAQVIKPRGVVRVDPELGAQEQYRGRALVRVVVREPWKPLRLFVKTQGCADVGVCYTPISRTIEVP